MLGSLLSEKRQATVVGAGISGLLAAYSLDKQGFEVTLVEESGRAGGLLRTARTELGIVESAAHSFLATDPVRRICADLGVELVPVRPEARARYVLRDGRMRRFPLSPWETLKTGVRAYVTLSSPEASRGDATMEDWTRRHLGEAALRYLVSPFLTGIYGARPQEISVGPAFPALEIPAGHSLVSAWLRKKRLRLLGGKTPREEKHMMAPKAGIGELARALELRLDERLGARFQRGRCIDELPEAANLILAVPAYRAGPLLARQDAPLAEALLAIRYAPLVSATVFIARDAFRGAPPRGVGVLIPEAEKRDCLGVLFNSSAFAGRVSDETRWVSLTMMLGGTPRPELATLDEENLRSVVRRELAKLFSLDEALLAQARIFVSRHPKAIPLYDSNLARAWSRARAGWSSAPGRILAGNYTGQVSLRGLMGEAGSILMKPGRNYAEQLS